MATRSFVPGQAVLPREALDTPFTSLIVAPMLALTLVARLVRLLMAVEILGIPPSLPAQRACVGTVFIPLMDVLDMFSVTILVSATTDLRDETMDVL